MNNNTYENPLTSRYAGREMSRCWSPLEKFTMWRILWVALAKAQRELGIDISAGQISEMESKIHDIDIESAVEKEKELRHDVMSHIHVFGEQCPNARPVIHLGATSCFVTDNGELIQMRNAMQIIRVKLLKVIDVFAGLAAQYKDMPTLGFTHYQPAQLTTVGKRFSLYLQDFMMDLARLEKEIEGLPFRSAKGTTGTQASFLALFDGDREKVRKLERIIAKSVGFKKLLPLSGQTYTRKIDYNILTVLSGIAQSAAKFATDLRLLANRREMEEPFGASQVGSSAMAYKRNPMRSERICSLARYLMSLPANAAATHANQWLERTLDDSANRRIVVPESFLACDVILSLTANVASGIQLWPKVIRANIERELPFMATENILMAAVREGGDRQNLHEIIRKHSMEASRRMKEDGAENELLELLRADPAFEKIRNRMTEIVNPEDFTGCAPEQVEEFLDTELKPLLKERKWLLDSDAPEEEIKI